LFADQKAAEGELRAAITCIRRLNRIVLTSEVSVHAAAQQLNGLGETSSCLDAFLARRSSICIFWEPTPDFI